MKALPAWVTYTVLRLALIVVPLVILLLLQVPWPIATIAAVVIGFCVSYLVLLRSRSAVSRDLYKASTRKRRSVGADDEDEDAADDALRTAHGSELPPSRSTPREAAVNRPASDREEESPAEKNPIRQPGDPSQFQSKD